MRREQERFDSRLKACSMGGPLTTIALRPAAAAQQPLERLMFKRRPPFSARRLIGAIASVALASAAQAQVAPDAGQIQRQIEQELRTPDIQQPPDSVTPEAVIDTAGPQVIIRRVELEGVTLVADQELIEQFAPYLNRPVSLGELQAAAQTLVGVYRKHGWFARVQLPEQDVSDGTLRIRIVEGRFGQLQLQPGETRAKAGYVASVVSRHLDAGQPYSLADLERGLLLANDLPGIRADGTLRAGVQPGTSDLALTVADQAWLSGSLGASNHGNRFTGRAQASGNLALNNPSGYGDRLQLSALQAERLDYLAADYSLPLGYDGLRFTLGYSQVNYELGKSFAALDNQGETRTLRAGLTYPIVRSGQRNLWLDLDHTRARQEDETLGITLRERHIDTTALALRGDARDGWGGGGLSSARLALSAGRADLRNTFDRIGDNRGAGVDGQFAHLGLDLRRDQVLAPSLYLRGRFSGQLAFDNLDSSQQFNLGGPYGVRGYPINEGGGDSGALLQVELHSLLPWTGIAGLDGYAFIDGGVIRQRHTTWAGWDTADTGRNTYALYASGLGLAWSHPKGFTVNGVLATPLGNNPGGRNDRDQDGTRSGPRAWLTASQSF